MRTLSLNDLNLFYEAIFGTNAKRFEPVFTIAKLKQIIDQHAKKTSDKSSILPQIISDATLERKEDIDPHVEKFKREYETSDFYATYKQVPLIIFALFSLREWTDKLNKLNLQKQGLTEKLSACAKDPDQSAAVKNQLENLEKYIETAQKLQQGQYDITNEICFKIKETLQDPLVESPIFNGWTPVQIVAYLNMPALLNEIIGHDGYANKYSKPFGTTLLPKTFSIETRAFVPHRYVDQSILTLLAGNNIDEEVFDLVLKNLEKPNANNKVTWEQLFSFGKNSPTSALVEAALFGSVGMLEKLLKELPSNLKAKALQKAISLSTFNEEFPDAANVAKSILLSPLAAAILSGDPEKVRSLMNNEADYTAKISLQSPKNSQVDLLVLAIYLQSVATLSASSAKGNNQPDTAKIFDKYAQNFLNIVGIIYNKINVINKQQDTTIISPELKAFTLLQSVTSIRFYSDILPQGQLNFLQLISLVATPEVLKLLMPTGLKGVQDVVNREGRIKELTTSQYKTPQWRPSLSETQYYIGKNYIELCLLNPFNIISVLQTGLNKVAEETSELQKSFIESEKTDSWFLEHLTAFYFGESKLLTNTKDKNITNEGKQELADIALSTQKADETLTDKKYLGFGFLGNLMNGELMPQKNALEAEIIRHYQQAWERLLNTLKALGLQLTTDEINNFKSTFDAYRDTRIKIFNSSYNNWMQAYLARIEEVYQIQYQNLREIEDCRESGTFAKAMNYYKACQAALTKHSNSSYLSTFNCFWDLLDEQENPLVAAINIDKTQLTNNLDAEFNNVFNQEFGTAESKYLKDKLQQLDFSRQWDTKSVELEYILAELGANEVLSDIMDSYKKELIGELTNIANQSKSKIKIVDVKDEVNEIKQKEELIPYRVWLATREAEITDKIKKLANMSQLNDYQEVLGQQQDLSELGDDLKINQQKLKYLELNLNPDVTQSLQENIEYGITNNKFHVEKNAQAIQSLKELLDTTRSTRDQLILDNNHFKQTLFNVFKDLPETIRLYLHQEAGKGNQLFSIFDHSETLVTDTNLRAFLEGKYQDATERNLFKPLGLVVEIVTSILRQCQLQALFNETIAQDTNKLSKVESQYRKSLQQALTNQPEDTINELMRYMNSYDENSQLRYLLLLITSSLVISEFSINLSGDSFASEKQNYVSKNKIEILNDKITSIKPQWLQQVVKNFPLLQEKLIAQLSQWAGQRQELDVEIICNRKLMRVIYNEQEERSEKTEFSKKTFQSFAENIQDLILSFEGVNEGKSLREQRELEQKLDNLQRQHAQQEKIKLLSEWRRETLENILNKFESLEQNIKNFYQQEQITLNDETKPYQDHLNTMLKHMDDLLGSVSNNNNELVEGAIAQWKSACEAALKRIEIMRRSQSLTGSISRVFGRATSNPSSPPKTSNTESQGSAEESLSSVKNISSESEIDQSKFLETVNATELESITKKLEVLAGDVENVLFNQSTNPEKELSVTDKLNILRPCLEQEIKNKITLIEQFDPTWLTQEYKDIKGNSTIEQFKSLQQISKNVEVSRNKLVTELQYLEVASNQYENISANQRTAYKNLIEQTRTNYINDIKAFYGDEFTQLKMNIESKSTQDLMTIYVETQNKKGVYAGLVDVQGSLEESKSSYKPNLSKLNSLDKMATELSNASRELLAAMKALKASQQQTQQNQQTAASIEQTSSATPPKKDSNASSMAELITKNSGIYSKESNEQLQTTADPNATNEINTDTSNEKANQPSSITPVHQ
ncbi:MAG: hypothetical protein Tsb005_04110 [Gammaproteobacteria bacterium]